MISTEGSSLGSMCRFYKVVVGPIFGLLVIFQCTCNQVTVFLPRIKEKMYSCRQTYK